MAKKQSLSRTKMLGEGEAKLQTRLKVLEERYPEVKGSLFTPIDINGIQSVISLFLWYPHIEGKHDDRPCMPSAEGATRLAKLTVREANFLASVAVELASDDFTVNFFEANHGQLTYDFVPDDLPKT
jgi:hypothetical protein